MSRIRRVLAVLLFALTISVNGAATAQQDRKRTNATIGKYFVAAAGGSLALVSLALALRHRQCNTPPVGCEYVNIPGTRYSLLLESFIDDGTFEKVNGRKMTAGIVIPHAQWSLGELLRNFARPHHYSHVTPSRRNEYGLMFDLGPDFNEIWLTPSKSTLEIGKMSYPVIVNDRINRDDMRICLMLALHKTLQPDDVQRLMPDLDPKLLQRARTAITVANQYVEQPYADTLRLLTQYDAFPDEHNIGKDEWVKTFLAVGAGYRRKQ